MISLRRVFVLSVGFLAFRSDGKPEMIGFAGIVRGSESAVAAMFGESNGAIDNRLRVATQSQKGRALAGLVVRELRLLEPERRNVITFRMCIAIPELDDPEVNLPLIGELKLDQIDRETLKAKLLAMVVPDVQVESLLIFSDLLPTAGSCVLTGDLVPSIAKFVPSHGLTLGEALKTHNIVTSVTVARTAILYRSGEWSYAGGGDRSRVTDVILYPDDVVVWLDATIMEQFDLSWFEK